MAWTDTYSGEVFRITTEDGMWSDSTARVQSYGEVIARYHTFPEAKSLGPDGMPCNRRTVGLLQRRPVVLDDLVHIGKETNRLEEVEQGLVHEWDEVQLVFRDTEKVVPPVIEPPRRECQSSGAPVSGTKAKYCSAACKQQAYRQRNVCAGT